MSHIWKEARTVESVQWFISNYPNEVKRGDVDGLNLLDYIVEELDYEETDETIYDEDKKVLEILLDFGLKPSLSTRALVRRCMLAVIDPIFDRILNVEAVRASN